MHVHTPHCHAVAHEAWQVDGVVEVPSGNPTVAPAAPVTTVVETITKIPVPAAMPAVPGKANTIKETKSITATSVVSPPPSPPVSIPEQGNWRSETERLQWEGTEQALQKAERTGFFRKLTGRVRNKVEWAFLKFK